MRAAVLRESGLNVEDVSIDEPEGAEVRVRTIASGLCHSDLHFIDGSWPAQYPVVLGHEAAGVVDGVGPDVTDFSIGDHVIACVSVFCGRCTRCLSGQSYLCERQNTMYRRRRNAGPRLSNDVETVNQFCGLSSFGELMLVHQNALVSIAPEVPLTTAALIGCAVLTGTGAVFRTASVTPGSSVAVIGAGGVGMSIIQGARIAGATMIVAVDLDDAKLATARAMGATHVVNAETDDPVDAVRTVTGGGADYSFEAIGTKRTCEQAYQMAGTAGTATIVGMARPGTAIEIDAVDLFTRSKRLQGSLMGSNVFRIDVPRLVDFYLDGRLKLDEMVSRHFALEDIAQGFKAMQGGEVVRSVIDYDSQ